MNYIRNIVLPYKKKNSVQRYSKLSAVLRILDQNLFHSGIRIRIKEFNNFNPKKWFLSSWNMIRVVHPGFGFGS